MSSKTPLYLENTSSNHPQKKSPQVPHGNPPRLSRDKVCLHGRHYRLAETWPLPATMEQIRFFGCQRNRSYREGQRQWRSPKSQWARDYGGYVSRVSPQQDRPRICTYSLTP